MFVVSPLGCDDWLAGDGGKHLLSHATAAAKVNKSSRIPIEAGDGSTRTKTTCTWRQKTPPGKCTKDNPRDFIESDIYFDRTGFNRGFQFETRWQGCSTRRNVEDEQFIKRWSFLNKARILILLLRILGRISLMFPLWVVVEEKGRFATRRSAQNIFCQMITPSHALLLWRQQITSWSISAKGTRPSLISSFIIWGRK